MSAPKVVVFTGPTLSAGEVRSVLPQAQVRPPAARGDMVAEDWRPGDVALLIDGYFRERRSVGHKEILRVIADGVGVVGAASMGALRAVELGPCGMTGIGTVYGMYADGEIDGDDEVGVLHGSAEKGYPPLSVALVNLRYGCREGAESGLVPPDSGRRVVQAAKALPFTHRDWPDLERALDESDHDTLLALREMIDSGVWDVKRLDAMAAVRAVADGAVAAAATATSEVPLTGISRTQLMVRRSRREYAPGRWMSDLDVLDAARLFDPGYPERHELVLTNLLTGLAAEQGMTLAEYAQTTLGVDGLPLPPGLARWLTEPERTGLPAAEQARLVMVRVWPVWQSADWRPAVIDHLRASEGWTDWCDIVARADQTADQTRGRLVIPPSALRARVFLRHWPSPGGSSDIESARRGFSGAGELGGAVGRFFAFDVQRAREKAAAG